MRTLIALYARTFVLGILVAAPVGAMGLLCIQRTLGRGWRAGLATGLGIATADAVYAAVAAFGVAAVSSVLVAWQTPLQLVGGMVLVYLGVRPLMAPAAECAPVEPAEARPRHASTYASAFGLTLTNPTTIMAFGAIVAGAGLVAQPGVLTAATATAGIASGSLAWWIALVASVTLARHAVGTRTVSRISRVSGLVIAAFGVVAVGSAILTLAR